VTAKPRIIAIGDLVPQVAPDAVVLPGATVAGDVQVGPRSSIWYDATVHADEQPVRIGADSNIQDGAIVRGDASATRIGDRVSVGHAAVVRGATVDEDCIIGNGAVLLNGAHVERGCIVAAGTLLNRDQRIPAGSLVIGSTGRILRDLESEDRAQIAQAWRVYATLARIHALDAARDATG
jgi:carbonic anhydrase/acetyltransferase-like protein (isoleucine patch superfamily)